MKKLIAMFLAMAMALALCACADQGTPYVPPVNNSGNGGTTAPTEEATEPVEEEPSIVGKWVGEVDLEDSLEFSKADMKEMLGENSVGLFWPEDITFTVVYWFRADGSVEADIDREDALAEWREQIVENGTEHLLKMLEEEGMTEEDYEESSGQTLEDYIQEYVLDVIEFDDMWKSASLEEDTYTLIGELLYLGDVDDDDYYVIDLDDDTFTIEDTSEDPGEFAFIMEPVYKRQ